jgi:hypothetical protein
VKVLAGGAVGLAAADVFYFGNAIGEAGNLTADAKVTTLDVSLTRANQISFPAPPPVITNMYDFNRDHKVNTMDVSLVRSNLTTVMNALKLITVPAEGTLALAAADGSSGTPGVLRLAAFPATDDGFAKPQALGAPQRAAFATRTMDALAATVALSGAPALGLPVGRDGPHHLLP